jgi:nicotinamidase-related amidase
MIEDKIDALIAAMNNLTAAIVGSTVAPPPPPVTPAKPKADKPKKAPAKSEEEIVKEVAQAAEAEVTVTKDQVSAAVQELLKANKRQEAIDLLARFKAKSVSGLAEADYAAFVDGANEVLMAG